MLDDLVLDTNVMLHAENPNEPRRQGSRDLLEGLLRCKTSLRIDEARDSLIIGEYRQKLRPGMLATVVVAKLAAEKRVLPVEKPSRKIKNFTLQTLRKPMDRVFLRVAAMSEDKVLVTHDFEDFQTKKRVDIKRKLGVRVLEASECLPRL